MPMADGWCLAAAGMLVLLAVACEEPGPTHDAGPPPAPAAPATASAWQDRPDGPAVAVPGSAADPALAAELDLAIARARTTADDARKRWEARASGEANDEAWAVKWAAPTEAGGVEHVWVVPLRWSAFRIEGRLASSPREPLACGRILSELVSFPGEELSDWVVETGGRREGGYTIEVLERRFGRPD